MPGRAVIERKVKADGSVQEFACEAVHETGSLAVIRFELDGGGGFATPVPVPQGAVSFGFFWRRRPYGLYRMVDAAGEPFLHRFDALSVTAIEPGLVEWRDLVLDWWVLDGERIVDEDRDEFEALVAADGLPPADVERALAAERAVLSRYRHIIDEAVALLRRHGRRR